MRSSILMSLLVSAGLMLISCDDESDPNTDGSGGTSASSSSGTAGGNTGGDAPQPQGPCEIAEKIGYFGVQHEVDYTTVAGEVKDAVVPATILEEVNVEGDCRLLRRNNPFCNPPCQGGYTCNHSGECIPYPADKSVGQVTISGLNKAVVLEPGAYFDTTMPHPGFDPGADVRLSAAGADYSAFKMYGQGFAPIATTQDEWVLEKDTPLTITWTTDDSAEYARVYLKVNVDQHGNSPVELRCDVADTGEATISAALVTELLNLGVSGYPRGDIYRRTVDSVAVSDGCIEFEVYSRLQTAVSVEGHIPCSQPSDCPDEMTCDIPTNTCVDN